MLVKPDGYLGFRGPLAQIAAPEKYVLWKILLGPAGTSHDGGISTGDKAREAPRALGYEAGNRLVSSFQARTSSGRVALFGSCGVAPNWYKPGRRLRRHP